MDKTAIKNFAIWARKKLIADSVYKARLLGITDKGIQDPLPQSTTDAQFFDIGLKEPAAVTGDAIAQRKNLVAVIQEKAKEIPYEVAFSQVMEETAYTWFNRLIAIRFMEVNDYLPGRVRVLSSDNPEKIEPDLVTSPFDSDLTFSEGESQQIVDWKMNNQTDDLFRMLFIKTCNALNEPLPMLFEKIADYTELLLTISISDRDGVVWHLVHDIPQDDFQDQVQIIGWLYQYYNTEPKDRLINARKKYLTYDIPFVTQLFTPDWIVHFIVENSLGKIWAEGHPNDKVLDNWKYLLKDKDSSKLSEDISGYYSQLKLDELRCMDPCVGSGHILAYGFDVLMQIYLSCGYTPKDAVKNIVQYNLFGLDIDKRAVQLASFSIMMKSCQYDKRFLKRKIIPRIYCIEKSMGISKECFEYFANGDAGISDSLSKILAQMKEADVYGSLIKPININFRVLNQRLNQVKAEPSLFNVEIEKFLVPVVQSAELLSNKYLVVFTNPPYMANSYMPTVLKQYVADNYPDSKADLYASFIVRCSDLCSSKGQIGLLTPYTWMFIQSFQALRQYVLSHMTFSSLVQLEYNAFESACVPVVAFTLKNFKTLCPFWGIKLSDFKGIGVQAPKTLYAVEHDDCNYKYYANQENFAKIPGSPVAYWVGHRIFELFNKCKKIINFGEPRHGMSTGNNDLCLRLWYEVEYHKIKFDAESLEMFDESHCKFAPYRKGGSFRRWYGNNDYVIAYDGQSRFIMSQLSGYRSSSTSYFFQPSINWSDVSSSYFGARMSPKGFAFDGRGASFFCDEDMRNYCLGILSSCFASNILKILNPTLTFNIENIANIPVIIAMGKKYIIDSLVSENIVLSKNEWDCFETSWDFRKFQLLKENPHSIKDEYKNIKNNFNNHFQQLKQNEEELNRIFIDIYGLQDEMTPEESDKDVTVHRIFDTKDDVPESMKGSNYVLTKQDVIESFISYAVGCMFGRYSLDTPGLAYAGGDWDDSKYTTFLPDEDNVLPITDEDYFDDDIVGRFVDFVKIVYGADTLEENLTFIADALGTRGKSSREVIRNYFLKDFFKDHCKTYQKRPIYWLYDSGKQNGFKALVYLHRCDENTTGRVRADYLHRMEQIYTGEVSRMQDIIDHSHSAHEVSVAEKRLEKMKKQIKECQDYDAKLGHLALDRIHLDLDDGVKINYRKAQTGRDGQFYEVLADSKAIMSKDSLWHEYLTEWPHEQ